VEAYWFFAGKFYLLLQIKM